MDYESVFTDSKWEIIKALSSSSRSPTELAKITGTTIANMSIQLRLLQALGFVEKQKLSTVTRGKPRSVYSMKNEFVYLVSATKMGCSKKLLNLNNETSAIFNILSISNSKLHHYIYSFYFKHYDVISKSCCFTFLGSKEGVIEFLIIHEDPGSLYERFNNIVIHKGVEFYKINSFIHSEEEIRLKIRENDEYFISLLKRSSIIIDNKGFITDLRRRKSYE